MNHRPLLLACLGLAAGWLVPTRAEERNAWPLTVQQVDATGQVKQSRPERPAAGPAAGQRQDTLSPLMRRLHDGNEMGFVWQLIIFIGGIAPAVLHARNPRLVICALTGYGQTGVLARRAAVEVADLCARAWGQGGREGEKAGWIALPLERSPRRRARTEHIHASPSLPRHLERSRKPCTRVPSCQRASDAPTDVALSRTSRNATVRLSSSPPPRMSRPEHQAPPELYYDGRCVPGVAHRRGRRAGRLPSLP
mgnify:CR=1 FL=1